MAGEKTEKATPKRKDDERKKGNVFFSREVISIAALLASFYSFKLLSPLIFTTIEDSLISFVEKGATQTEITVQDTRIFLIEGIIVFAKAALILLLIGVIVNIITTMAQTRMLVSSKNFAFKAERISFINGFKKLFSVRSLMELLKSMLKIIILLYIVYSVLKDEIMLLPRLMDMDALQAIIYTGQVIMKIVTQAGLIFVFLAAADYLFQWWQYEKNLRMSKQEIKDEYKQIEGNPEIKGRVRTLQQQRARQRMMQNVPKADVVIRNPTHYAVAIQYDQEKHRAPVVLAKGADAVALRIIAVAEENDVYITENRPLARALFETVDIDAEIPAEHYQAIAEVLAFVYSLKKKDLNR
ncbi:flagellar biosynthesis protein FlhB [Scatolibacter rhodanostii]|uniref:flagellar biosynthesis protein FlhB n=1 Tax=Scatolibacter rhodanostii TaxID=2014781 RepID=UPI000C073098|nr:flagellar biosynthesis protein FlhB [Scatolibacter rhodanostii]